MLLTCLFYAVDAFKYSVAISLLLSLASMSNKLTFVFVQIQKKDALLTNMPKGDQGHSIISGIKGAFEWAKNKFCVLKKMKSEVSDTRYSSL